MAAEGNVDQLVYSRFFPHPHAGRVFVDVGAARPDFLSNSALYRDLGWRVIAIEPNPEFAALHRKAGHEVYEYACGVEDRDAVDFCVVDSHNIPYAGGGHVSYESYSSLALKPGYAQSLPAAFTRSSIRVNVRRLDTILREAGVDRVDLLSVDVEGWELEVLAGFDLARFAPPVMIIENWLNDAAYQRALGAAGYVCWQQHPPNDIYVRPALLSIGERARAAAAYARHQIWDRLRQLRRTLLPRVATVVKSDTL